MVSKSSSNAQKGPIPPQSKERPSTITKSLQGNSSTLGQTKPTSLSLIREGLHQYNFSSTAKDVLKGLESRFFKAIPNLPNKMASVLH